MYTFVVHSLSITQLYCQTDIQESISDSLVVDSNEIVSSTLPFDTVDINIKDDDIKSPVHYKALDSIVYDVENKMLYLYGNGEMKYTDTEVEADRVAFDWNTQTLLAEGIDSLGKKVGTPVLVQNGKTYEAKKMEFNFKTQKGKIYDVVSSDNGAFIHSEIVQKTKDNEWLSYKAKYTTCSNKEDPHFYIQARKAKIIPDKIMVSGPANLVVSGINTPLALPFAIFPIKSGRRSGIIMPKFGTKNNYYSIFDGGYYWAVNEHLSLGFTGEFVTDGTYGFKVASNYKVRYKSTGNVLLSYRRQMPSDPIKDPNGEINDYEVRWSHRMDSKADPNNTFSANVNVKSSSFNKNALIQKAELLEVVNSSHITYTRRFNGKPFNLTISANHSQSNKTHKFAVTLPEIAFNVSKITPFKPKVKSKNKKFYEKIGFKYNIKAKATALGVDTTFFDVKTLDDVRFGINQKFNVDASYSLFKYFQFTPSANYEEQWFFKEETLDYYEHFVQKNDTLYDTLYTESSFNEDLYARRNFNIGATLGTTLKGVYSFKKGAIKGIRHTIKPSVSYNYHPDFSAPMWNYYDSYYNERKDQDVTYNQFKNTGIYGSPNIGESNSINFNIGNNLEMKVLNKKDTSKLYKKIPLLKSLSITSGYNFAGDSIGKFKDITISARTSFLNNLFGLSGVLRYNPYSVSAKNRKISDLYLDTDNKLLRFVSLDFNVDFNISAKTKKKKQIVKNEYGTIEEQEYITSNPELYYDFDIPWSFYARYHMSLKNGINGLKNDTLILGIGSLTFGGNINITPKWKIDVRSGYDFKSNDLVLTNLKLIRDLHCWEMSLDWTPYPIRSQSFVFELRVKSTILQELKLTRKQDVSYNSSF